MGCPYSTLTEIHAPFKKFIDVAVRIPDLFREPAHSSDMMPR
jgi:hypothetical protein